MLMKTNYTIGHMDFKFHYIIQRNSVNEIKTYTGEKRMNTIYQRPNSKT